MNDSSGFVEDFYRLLDTTREFVKRRVQSPTYRPYTEQLLRWQENVFERFDTADVRKALHQALETTPQPKEGPDIANLLRGEINAVRAFHERVLEMSATRGSAHGSSSRPWFPWKKGLEMVKTVIGSMLDLLNLPGWLKDLFVVAQEAIDLAT